MTGVLGGDVTLHAAITDTLAAHPWRGWAGDELVCAGEGCDWSVSRHFLPKSSSDVFADHVADRVLAVLADRLPHTPPDQLAGLIGGTVVRATLNPLDAQPFNAKHVMTPWVPDSPPAAPEPDHAAPQRSAALRDADGEVRRTAAPEPRQDT